MGAHRRPAGERSALGVPQISGHMTDGGAILNKWECFRSYSMSPPSPQLTPFSSTVNFHP